MFLHNLRLLYREVRYGAQEELVRHWWLYTLTLVVTAIYLWTPGVCR